MSVTQYIGSRYVPVFAEPSEWNSTRTYEPLTIVQHEGNSYTSKQSVPIGVKITDERFWAPTGNYNAQVEAYRREVKNYTDKLNIFSTVSDMQKAKYLQIGDFCRTLGYHKSSDGGGAYYVITDTTTDVQVGSYYASFIDAYNEVTPEMFGARGDGVTDDTSALLACMNYRNINIVNTYAYTKNIYPRPSTGYTPHSINIYSKTDGKIYAINDSSISFNGDIAYFHSNRKFSTNLRISNIRFEMASQATYVKDKNTYQSIVRIIGYENATIEGCSFTNAAQNAFSAHTSHYVNICDCHFSNIGYAYPALTISRNAIVGLSSTLIDGVAGFYDDMHMNIDKCKFDHIANECVSGTLLRSCDITNCVCQNVQDYIFEKTNAPDSIPNPNLVTEVMLSNCFIYNNAFSLVTNSSHAQSGMNVTMNNVIADSIGGIPEWYKKYNGFAIAISCSTVRMYNCVFKQSRDAIYKSGLNTVFWGTQNIELHDCTIDYSLDSTRLVQDANSLVMDRCKLTYACENWAYSKTGLISADDVRLSNNDITVKLVHTSLIRNATTVRLMDNIIKLTFLKDETEGSTLILTQVATNEYTLTGNDISVSSHPDKILINFSVDIKKFIFCNNRIIGDVTAIFMSKGGGGYCIWSGNILNKKISNNNHVPVDVQSFVCTGNIMPEYTIDNVSDPRYVVANNAIYQ
jgi:hypothetical protein